MRSTASTLMRSTASTVEVACDESGNDGENLFGGHSTVFAHGSVAIALAQAESLMAELRHRTNAQSAELKSKDLLRPKNLRSAQWLLRHPAVAGNALVTLTEKRYFLTCKLFDSTVEEQMHSAGVDIYADDQALRLAMFLYSRAGEELGPKWDETLDTYNRLLRSPDEAEIRRHLATLRAQLIAVGRECSGLLNNIICMIWGGTDHLLSLARQQAGLDASEKLRTLDPVISAIGQTARNWGERSGQDVIVVHDQAKVLTPKTIEYIKYHLARPDFVAPSLAGGGVVVKAIHQVDSKTDARVQVADVVAGVGRAVAERALRGESHPLRQDLQPMIDPLSIWGDVSSWVIMHPTVDG
ncbi:DUF3800 domain-containing protein [Intrasporangium flavum]|uniref:DUF3800 domain-containing protein n=1 Tax=Intrasporangium flavum TaxID=1428657 RepID=UPI00096F1F9C|nr:DUF3800 domain-containing protein [Intrasporangium flavum]